MVRRLIRWSRLSRRLTKTEVLGGAAMWVLASAILIGTVVLYLIHRPLQSL
jgi:hypothetical protein